MDRRRFDELVQAAYAAVGCEERWNRQVEPRCRCLRGDASVESASSSEEEYERRMLERHLGTALHLHRRLIELEQRNAALLEALDRCGSGLLVCDESGRVDTASRRAEELLSGADGIEVRRSWPASEPPVESGFRGLFGKGREAGSAPGWRLARLQRSGGRPGQELLLVPLGGSRFPPRTARVLMFVHDPARAPSISSSLLRELYDLTPREVAVARLICSGDSPEGVAARLGVKRETVKSHLKALYLKTGTHRQAELVARLLGGLARIEVGTDAPGCRHPTEAPPPAE